MSDPDVRNPHEERARAAKAYRLVRLLLLLTEHGDAAIEELAADVPTWRPSDRLPLARLARVHPPSDETWALVCAMVEEERSIRESVPGVR